MILWFLGSEGRVGAALQNATAFKGTKQGKLKGVSHKTKGTQTAKLTGTSISKGGNGKNNIELDSFSFGASNPANVGESGKGTSAGKGKVDTSDLNVGSKNKPKNFRPGDSLSDPENNEKLHQTFSSTTQKNLITGNGNPSDDNLL